MNGIECVCERLAAVLRTSVVWNQIPQLNTASVRKVAGIAFEVLVRPVDMLVDAAGVKAAAGTGHSAYLSTTTETTHLAATKATAARFSLRGEQTR